MADDQGGMVPRAKKDFHLLKGEKDLRERNQLCNYCGRAYHIVDVCKKRSERNRREANNLCVYCGKSGHKMPDCPKLNPYRRQRISNGPASEQQVHSSNALSIYRLTPPKLARLGLTTLIEAEEDFDQEKQGLSLVSPQGTEQDTAGPLENASSISKDTMPEAESGKKTTDPTPGQAQDPTGFFKLPREVRNLIYLETLRPDCKLQFPGVCKLHHECVQDPLGRMKLLALSSRVYFEAIEVLHSHENLITVNSSKIPPFRKARDFGKPGMFASRKPDHQVFIGARYGELQFLRFRNLAICLELHGINTDFEGHLKLLDPFEKRLLQLAAAIQKSPNLRRVRFLLRRDDKPDYYSFFILGRGAAQYWPRNSLEYQVEGELKKLLRPFLSVLHAKGIKISAEEHRLYRGHGEDVGEKKIAFAPELGDPLVGWINAVTPVKLRSYPAFSFMDLSFTTTNERGDTFLMQHVYRDSEEKYPDMFIPEGKERFNNAFGATGNAVYELIPECRACYHLFGSWENLKAHLDKTPNHKVPFRVKAFNEIVPYARRGGWLKCPTCAEELDCKRLDLHLDRTGHRRWGMIPRYKEDNWSYNRKDRDRFQAKVAGDVPEWSFPGFYRPDYGG